MLGFIRKHSAHIALTIVVLFAGSIVIFGLMSTFFISAKYKIPRTQTQQQGASEIALINGSAVDPMAFNRRVYQAYMGIPEQQRPYLDPNMIERLKYNVFQQLLQFQLLLAESKKQKITVAGGEMTQRINQILSTYKLKSKQELKGILKQNGIVYNQFLHDQREEMMVSKLIGSIIGGVKVEDKDMGKAFKEIKVSHILIKIPASGLVTEDIQAINVDNKRLRDETLRKANNVYEKVLAMPKKFGDYAKQYSQDNATATSGGDLGWVTYGQMPSEFEDMAFSMDKAEIGGPIQTVYGFHIIYVVDAKTKERPKDVTDEQIRNALLKDKQDKVLRQWMKPIFANVKIDYQDKELKAFSFKSQGKYAEAMTIYESLASQFPQDPMRNMMIAQIYQVQDDFTSAEKEYQKGLIKEELNPRYQHPSFHFALADFYIKKKELPKAMASLKKVEDIAHVNNDNMYVYQLLEGYYTEHKMVAEAKMLTKKMDDIKAQQEKLAQQKTSALGNVDAFSPLVTANVGPVKTGKKVTK